MWTDERIGASFLESWATRRGRRYGLIEERHRKVAQIE